MKNILLITVLFLAYQSAFSQNTKVRSRTNTTSRVTTPPAPVNDTVAMPGGTKDMRLLATFQPFVGKTNIRFNYVSSKAPNSDGTNWYSTFGEGTLNWNTNKTKLIGSFKRYFSDRKLTGQSFDKNNGEPMTIEIDATNQKITLNSNATYTTELRNGLLYGFNMANEIIIITLPPTGMQ